MARSVRPRIFSPFVYARRAFVYRGLMDGNRAWLVLGGTVWAGRLIRGMVGRRETIAATRGALTGTVRHDPDDPAADPARAQGGAPRPRLNRTSRRTGLFARGRARMVAP